MHIHNLSERRKQLGLSQVDLARLSGISLPTIQNIETRRANPSLQTLEQILNVLGLRMKFYEKPVNWDLLISLGAPLTGKSMNLEGVNKSELLISELKLALLNFSELKSREQDVIYSMILSLKFHYPSYYKKIQKLALNKELKTFQLEGRHIKLSKIFLSQSSHYL